MTYVLPSTTTHYQQNNNCNWGFPVDLECGRDHYRHTAPQSVAVTTYVVNGLSVYESYSSVYASHTVFILDSSVQILDVTTTNQIMMS